MKTILVADDNPDIRQLLVDILQEEYRVITAESGHEAVDAVGREKIDAVLMDLEMPGFIKGDKATMLIKSIEQTKRVPLIIVSGSTRMDLFEKCRQAGAADIITKPFTPDDLLQVLEKHLNK